LKEAEVFHKVVEFLRKNVIRSLKLTGTTGRADIVAENLEGNGDRG
jgi:hypothetical protein